MARSERQGDLLLWGGVGLGVGLLAGFVLAELVGGRAALASQAPEGGIPGEQEGTAPDGSDPGYPDLTLADQSA